MSENKITYFEHNNTLALRFTNNKQLSGSLYNKGYRYNKDFKHYEIYLHDREIYFAFKMLGNWKRSPTAQELFKRKKNILKAVQLKQITNPNGFIISDFCSCYNSTYVQYSDLNEITRVLALKSGGISLITAPENKKNKDYCPEAQVYSYNEIHKIPDNSLVVVDEICNFSPDQKRAKNLLKNSSRFKIILMSQKEFNKLGKSVIVLLQMLDPKLDKDRIVNKYVHSLSTSKHIQDDSILYKKAFLDYSYKIILQGKK